MNKITLLAVWILLFTSCSNQKYCNSEESLCVERKKTIKPFVSEWKIVNKGDEYSVVLIQRTGMDLDFIVEVNAKGQVCLKHGPYILIDSESEIVGISMLETDFNRLLFDLDSNPNCVKICGGASFNEGCLPFIKE